MTEEIDERSIMQSLFLIYVMFLVQIIICVHN